MSTEHQKTNAFTQPTQELEANEGMKSFAPPKFALTAGDGFPSDDAPQTPVVDEAFVTEGVEQTTDGQLPAQLQSEPEGSEMARQGDPAKKTSKTTFVPRYIPLTETMDRESFRQLALKTVFGDQIPENIKWNLTQDQYGPADSPVKVLVDTNLLLKLRNQANDGKGIPSDEKGKVDGAESRKTAFGQSPASAEKTGLMAEIDRRYYEATGMTPGEKITNSPEDAGKRALWEQIQDEVLFQHDYLKALPEVIKQLVRTTTAQQEIGPSEMDQLFRIAKKIEGMEPSQVRDYISKINGGATDLNTLEASIDRSIQQNQERKEENEKRSALQTKLYDLQGLYRLYQSWKSLKTNAVPKFGGGTSFRDPNADYFSDVTNDVEAELNAALHQAEFGSIAEFEQYIRDYEKAFEKEAVAITFDILGKYEGQLYRESERLKDPKILEGLFQQLGGFREQQKAYNQQTVVANSHQQPSMPFAPMEKMGGAGNPGKAAASNEKASVAQSSAETQLQGLSLENPIFQESHLPADKQLDKNKLANAGTAAELGSLIQAHIEARLEDVRDSKENIQEDPKLIYQLDKLMPTFYARMSVEPGNTCDLIVKDKIGSIEGSEALIAGILVVLAVALAVASYGASTPLVAAAASAGGLGISGYMALDAYQEYSIQNDLAGAGLMDDPSILWLVVSLAALALDLGAVKKAVTALTPAAKALNAGGDAADFAKAVKILQDSGEIEEKIAVAAERAATAKQGFKDAANDFMDALVTKSHAVDPGSVPSLYESMVKMASAKIQQGVSQFEIFMLEIKNTRKLAGLGEMTSEELAAAKKAWGEAEVKAATVPTVIDTNRYIHIFEKEMHELNSLVAKFGTQEEAYQAVQKAANLALMEGKLTPNAKGVLKSGNAGDIIDVEGMPVRLIGGWIKDGKVVISSFSRYGL